MKAHTVVAMLLTDLKNPFHSRFQPAKRRGNHWNKLQGSGMGSSSSSTSSSSTPLLPPQFLLELAVPGAPTKTKLLKQYGKVAEGKLSIAACCRQLWSRSSGSTGFDSKNSMLYLTRTVLLWLFPESTGQSLPVRFLTSADQSASQNPETDNSLSPALRKVDSAPAVPEVPMEEDGGEQEEEETREEDVEEHQHSEFETVKRKGKGKWVWAKETEAKMRHGPGPRHSLATCIVGQGLADAFLAGKRRSITDYALEQIYVAQDTHILASKFQTLHSQLKKTENLPTSCYFELKPFVLAMCAETGEGQEECIWVPAELFWKGMGGLGGVAGKGVTLVLNSHTRCDYDKLTWRAFWSRPPARGTKKREEDAEEKEEEEEEEDEEEEDEDTDTDEEDN